MLRTTASKAALSLRRGAPRVAPCLQQSSFHVSSRNEDEAKSAELAKSEDPGWYTPAYGIAAGVAFAVPAINYQWYLVNEETQLAACFICFCGVVYHNFGTAIKDFLEEDGKQILANTNAVEDANIANIQAAIADLKSQQGLVEQLEAMNELQAATYAKMNETGKVKPLYGFKAQVEKLLAVIAAEEAASQEKAKMTMMDEATAAVKVSFASNQDLKKKSLANAVAILKGSKPESSPVKEAYLDFFAQKKAAAEGIDEATEIQASRDNLITKLKTVAMTDKFYFHFDAEGKPKMNE